MTGLRLSLDEGLIISSAMDGLVGVWDPATRQCVRTINAHKGIFDD